MTLAPTATDISVRELLAKFDGEFSAVAQAIENGEFAFWVGSGISRRSPNLGRLIERAIEYMRVRAIYADHSDACLPALREAIKLGDADHLPRRDGAAGSMNTAPGCDLACPDDPPLRPQRRVPGSATLRKARPSESGGGIGKPCRSLGREPRQQG